MRGLFLKDFYQYKQYCRLFFLMVIPLFLVLSFSANGGNTFLLFYPAMLAGMMPMTIMAYEEKDRWDVYSRLLPYRISWLVSVKYLTVLLLNFILLMVILGLMVLKLAVRTSLDNGMGYSLPGIAVILLSAGLLGPALLYPFCFRNGVEKARMMRMIYIIIYCAIGGISSGLIEYTELSLLKLLNQPIGAALIGGASMTIFFLSWALSIKWYREREF